MTEQATDLASAGQAAPEIDPIESKAREMGWKPQEEFSGEPHDWVDAREFVGRKPLFDRLHEQGRQIKGLEKTLKATTEHVQKVGEIAYKRAVSELQKERRTAIEDADARRVNEIDQELGELKQDRAQAAQQTNEPPAEFTNWVEKNSWFNTDRELFDFACAAFDAHQKRNPNVNLDEALAEVTKVTKRAYPEKFGQKPAAPTHSAVEGSKTPTQTRRGPGYGDLSDDQKRVCDNFVKSGVLTRDQYIKQLADIGELRSR